MKRIIFIVVALGFTATANAQTYTSSELATSLATIIASEDFCGLKFNQDHIAQFIEENVAKDDMKFPAQLTSSIGGAQYNIEKLGDSGQVAHCTQVKRVAEYYGFFDAPPAD